MRQGKSDIKIFNDLLSYKERIFYICLGFSKDPGEAEELTQEVYFRAFKKISSLNNSRYLKEWLFKIAKNTCLDYLKKKCWKRLFRFKFNENFVEHNSPELLAIKNEQLQILKETIKNLPQKYREIFVLREYGHLSYQEIAAALGIKEGTVMSRLNRARQAIISNLREVKNGKQR